MKLISLNESCCLQDYTVPQLRKLNFDVSPRLKIWKSYFEIVISKHTYTKPQKDVSHAINYLQILGVGGRVILL
jgi:hypothetical protein